MKYLIPICSLIFLLTLGCQSEQTETAVTVPATEVPKLLQRHTDIQQGKEWELVQSVYGRNLAKLRQNPQADEPYLKIAEVFVNEARITGEHGHYYPAALQVIERAMADGIENQDLEFRLLVLKAGVELSQHEFKQALSTAQAAVSINPYNAQIYGALVDAYVELGNYEEAVQMADKMVSIRPDLRSYSRVSYLREIHGDVQGAIEAMEMAVSAGYPGYEATAWTRLTLGELYERYGQTEKAQLNYEMALHDRPDYPFALANLANLDMARGDYELAESRLERARQAIPEFGFYIQLAQIYKANNRQEELREIKTEILAMLADDVAHGHNMDMEYSDLYLELFEEPKKALNYAQRAYDNRPENIDVNRQMATIYLALNDLDKVNFHLVQASRTKSQHPALDDLKHALAML